MQRRDARLAASAGGLRSVRNRAGALSDPPPPTSGVKNKDRPSTEHFLLVLHVTASSRVLDCHPSQFGQRPGSRRPSRSAPPSGRRRAGRSAGRAPVAAAVTSWPFGPSLARQHSTGQLRMLPGSFPRYLAPCLTSLNMASGGDSSASSRSAATAVGDSSTRTSPPCSCCSGFRLHR